MRLPSTASLLCLQSCNLHVVICEFVLRRKGRPVASGPTAAHMLCLPQRTLVEVGPATITRAIVDHSLRGCESSNQTLKGVRGT